MDGDPHPEHLHDQPRVENVRRCSPGGDATRLEQHQVVAILRGHVQVVEHDRDGPALGVQASQQLHDLQLMVEVEVVERLVKQEDGRLLGEGLGDEGALPLAAGELGDQAAGQLGHSGRLEGRRNGDLVGVAAQRAAAGHRRGGRSGPWPPSPQQ